MFFYLDNKHIPTGGEHREAASGVDFDVHPHLGVTLPVNYDSCSCSDVNVGHGHEQTPPDHL